MIFSESEEEGSDLGGFIVKDTDESNQEDDAQSLIESDADEAEEIEVNLDLRTLTRLEAQEHKHLFAYDLRATVEYSEQ